MLCVSHKLVGLEASSDIGLMFWQDYFIRAIVYVHEASFFFQIEFFRVLILKMDTFLPSYTKYVN